MAATVKKPIEVVISDIRITEWIDVTTKVERSYTPNTMVVCATIDGIWTENIMIKYIPITSKNEIIEEVKKVLMLSHN